MCCLLMEVPYIKGRPILEVEIEGPKGSRNLKSLVDTGSDYTSIHPEVGREIGLRLSNKVEEFTIAGGERVHAL